MVGPMGPCVLGKDKLKRPKRWTDWHKDAENKMRFSGITNSVQKMNFLRSCAGVELTELWEKEVRVVFEGTREGEVEVPAHTYEQVVESTKLTLLKLVSKDRATIDLLRMEQGGRGFMDFLVDVEDQIHLCHSWEALTGKDMKRISLLSGLKDRMLAEKALAEEYSLKQIIQAAVNRESSKANAEALRNRPTGSVNRLDEEEVQYTGGSLEARMNHLMEEMEEVRKLRQIGKYRSRHKDKGEKEQCPRYTYKRHEAGQKCPAEDMMCNTRRDKGHFGVSKLCRKKKKKAARRVKEERKETSSESSDTEEEKEINRVIRDQMWPETCGKARKRNVRHIMVEGHMNKDEGAGRRGTYKAESAGRLGMYKAEVVGHQGMNKDKDAGRRGMYEAEGRGRQGTYKTDGTGR